MNTTRKKRAPAPVYTSPNQLTLDCFQTPFDQKLLKTNRWVVLANLIPWDEICGLYLKQVGVSETGRPALRPRLVIGSMIIKHMCNLDDRETVDQISENMYMQYFLGYSSFTPYAPFDPSLFDGFRKRLGMDNLNAINEKIIALKTKLETTKNTVDYGSEENDSESNHDNNPGQSENKGRVIFDASVDPQDIAYPTDLDLISDAREKTEELIDKLYVPSLRQKKPRTYRQIARRRYLLTAKKKVKSRNEINRAFGSQLRFVRRNQNSINKLLDAYSVIPLIPKDQKCLLVINTLYEQQKHMHKTRQHKVEDRIVSIHEPHVRLIVRGKAQAKVEFGAKNTVFVIPGYNELSWNAFNEGSHMMEYVKKFLNRYGCYPRVLLADQIYCTRANRDWLKEKGIRVRLQNTSESWIASIILVLNLVKLAGMALHCLIQKWAVSFSARLKMELLSDFQKIIWLGFTPISQLSHCIEKGKN